MTQKTIGNPLAKIPAYRRIEHQIQAHIGSGRWTAGAMLPSRHSLAKEFNVSLGTVERAVTTLIADGILSASDRRGTFVSSGTKSPSGGLKHDGQATAQVKLFRQENNLSTANAGHTATLGVIATYLDELIDSGEYLAYWMRQTADALTTSYLNPGEISAFYNMHTDAPAAKISVVDAVTELQRQGVSAVAILDLHNQISPADLERLALTIDLYRNPLVYISSREIDAVLPHVYCDSANAGRQAFLYCVRRGITELTYIATSSSDWIIERYEGIRFAAERAGWSADAVASYWLDPPLQDPLTPGTQQRIEARRCGREVLAAPERYPRCIVAANDYIAYGVLDAANELDLISGKDFMLVGFDDTPQSLPYGLTSLRPPLAELGQEAARLLNRLEREGPTAVQVRARWQLIERASSRFYQP